MKKGIKSLMNLLIATLITAMLGLIITGKAHAFNHIGFGSTMEISQSGIDFIKRHEGLRLCRYKDAADVWTIGYGHAGFAAKKYECIKERYAEKLLKRDLATAERAVNRLVDITLYQHEYDALVSFVYNVGESAFARSTLLKKLNQANDHGASKEFRKWIHAGGKKNAGLQKRRYEERKLFLRGRYE